MPLASFLMGIVGALATRVLTALGIGWVSYAGISALAAQVVQQIQTYWGQGSIEVVNLLEMAGFGQAIGIMLGAIVARATLGAIARLGKLAA